VGRSSQFVKASLKSIYGQKGYNPISGHFGCYDQYTQNGVVSESCIFETRTKSPFQKGDTTQLMDILVVAINTLKTELDPKVAFLKQEGKPIPKGGYNARGIFHCCRRIHPTGGHARKLVQFGISRAKSTPKWG